MSSSSPPTAAAYRPSAAARKSGVGVGSGGQDSRTARKTGARLSTGAAAPSEDTEMSSENKVPVESTASPAASASASASSALPLVQSKRGARDNMLPPGVNQPGLGGKGRGGKGKSAVSGKSLPGHAYSASTTTTSSSLSSSNKPVVAAARGKQRAAAPAGDNEDDETTETASSLNVRSRSPRGYTWEVEVLEIQPDDVLDRISYHNSITTTIEREGKNERVRFRRGDKIWILPDPEWLPPVSEEVAINELADDEWWVGEILDCCALDQSKQRESSLGLLRVAWYYSPDHSYELPNLHDDWKKKLRRYRFDDPERIKSDHVDFIGIECFAGFADGIYTYLNLLGLEVDDAERMKPDRLRAKSKRVVRMTGFTLKEVAKRAAAREANHERNPALARKIRSSQRTASQRSMNYGVIQEDDDDNGEINED